MNRLKEILDQKKNEKRQNLRVAICVMICAAMIFGSIASTTSEKGLALTEDEMSEQMQDGYVEETVASEENAGEMSDDAEPVEEVTEENQEEALNEGNPNLQPGTTRTYSSILGNAVYYGIVADSINQTGHMDSNFATNYYNAAYGTANCTAGKYTNPYNGGQYLIASMGKSNLFIDKGDPAENFYILTTQEIIDAGKLINGTLAADGSNYAVKTQKELNDAVNGMLSYAAGQSSAMASETTYTYEVDQNNKTVDLTGYPDGTYYIDGKSISTSWGGNYSTLNELKIKKNDGQTIVFNFNSPDMTNIYLNNYFVNGKAGESQDSGILPYAKTIVFNMPYATSVSHGRGISGVVLAPNADFNLDHTSTGWLVCKNLTRSNGEWHYMYDGVPKYDGTTIKALKQVDCDTPTADEVFNFELYEY